MTTAVAHDLVQKSLVGEALDAGPVAIFVADDGKYLAVNAYACELSATTGRSCCCSASRTSPSTTTRPPCDALLKTGRAPAQ